MISNLNMICQNAPGSNYIPFSNRDLARKDYRRMNQINKATIQTFRTLNQLVAQVRPTNAANNVYIINAMLQPVKAPKNWSFINHCARRTELDVNYKS